MRASIILVMLLCLASASTAQKEVTIHVSKKVKTDSLSTTPDSIYLESHIPHAIILSGMAQGCRAKGIFKGGDLHIHNNIITLTPVYVYRDADVSPLDRKYFANDFKIATGDYYTAELQIDVYDSSGQLISSLNKKCYIKYEKPPVFDISAESLAPGARGILKISRPDSARKADGKRFLIPQDIQHTISGLLLSEEAIG